MKNFRLHNWFLLFFFFIRLMTAKHYAMGLVCMGLLFLWSHLGWAHGILLESFPKQDAILDQNPAKIVLRFNASLEPSMTHVVLEDMAMNITALHPTAESTIEQIVMTVPPLKPGVYHVRYRVLATDGHLTEGFVRFTLLSP